MKEDEWECCLCGSEDNEPSIRDWEVCEDCAGEICERCDCLTDDGFCEACHENDVVEAHLERLQDREHALNYDAERQY